VAIVTQIPLIQARQHVSQNDFAKNAPNVIITDTWYRSACRVSLLMVYQSTMIMKKETDYEKSNDDSDDIAAFTVDDRVDVIVKFDTACSRSMSGVNDRSRSRYNVD
jgi:hypothetical protein